MKKISLLLIILIFSLNLSGCRKKCAVTPAVRGISFSCAVKYYNECYEGDVSVAENGDTDIKITFPESLTGLILHFKGDGVTSEYSGLNYSCNISDMPEGTVFTYLYKILRDSENREVSLEDDKYFAENKNGSPKYRLYLGATGLPISAKDTSAGFSAEFKNVSLKKEPKATP